MKKKILFIHDSMAGGGAERVLLSLLTYINREKFDITLLLLYGEGAFMSEIPAHIKVVTLFESYKHFLTRVVTHFKPVRNFVRQRLALRRLNNRRFDTIVSFMEGPVMKLHSQLFSLADLNVTWVHCNLQLHRWYGFWLDEDDEKTIYGRMDRIAFVSSGVKSAFERLFDTKAQKPVIPNPVDCRQIVASGGSRGARRPGDPFKIVSVGRLIPAKCHDRLLDVVSILKMKGHAVAVEILGSGPLEGALKERARKDGLEDVVKFRGFVDNPYPSIKDADIFCLTSDTEGYGMVVAEALCLGTPVVSTRVDGVTDLLSPGGGVFTTNEPEDIALKIEELIKSPEKLEALRASTQRAASTFDIDTVIGAVEDFISC